MTKATQTLAYALAFLACWAVLLLDVVPLPLPVAQIVPYVSLPCSGGRSARLTAQVPLWVIVSFGAYLLGTLGWNIFTFRDKEDAYHALLKEIETAKSELRQKGVTVD